MEAAIFSGTADYTRSMLIAILASTGTVSNAISLSFFLRHQRESLADEHLIALNITDLLICLLSPVELFVTSRNVARLSRDGIGSKQDFFKFDQVIMGTVTGSASQLSCFITAALCLIRTLVLKKPLFIIRKRIVCLVHGISVFVILAHFICKISMACIIKPDLQNSTETHPNFSHIIFFALHNAEFGFILLTVVTVGSSSVIVARAC